jgi:hypothetical protein
MSKFTKKQREELKDSMRMFSSRTYSNQELEVKIDRLEEVYKKREVEERRKKIDKICQKLK